MNATGATPSARTRPWSRAVLSLMLIVLSAIGSSIAAPALIVSSKLSSESALIAQMIRLSAEAHHIPTVDRTVLGATPIMRRAILAGEIDLYIEYTGNAAYFYNQSQRAVWRDAQQGYAEGAALERRHGLIWLTMAPASNRWALALRNDVAQAYHVRTVSDLAELIRQGTPTIKLACSAEFVNSDTLKNLEKVYAFHLPATQLVILAGGETSAFMRAATHQTDGVNTALVYSTDGAIEASQLRLLEDDQNAEPIYAPVPIIRAQALQRYPQIAALSDAIMQKLDTATLQQLNARVQLDGVAITTVARQWLQSQGLIP